MGSKSHGGHSKGRSSGRFSSKTKSFVSGKIAGHYLSKGYSKLRSQHIGNVVVCKMGSTFSSGKGSSKSYNAGVIAGRYQGRNGYDLRMSTPCNSHSHRDKDGKLAKREISLSNNRVGGQSSKYDKNYGKNYK